MISILLPLCVTNVEPAPIIDHPEKLNNFLNREESQKKEEEQKELIDKAKERKEEAEQQTEAIRDAKDSQEEVLDGVNKTDTLELESNIKKNSVDHVEEAQKQINKIIKDNNLINEDLKGIEIDFNF